jgi:hypothetical protein
VFHIPPTRTLELLVGREPFASLGHCCTSSAQNVVPLMPKIVPATD